MIRSAFPPITTRQAFRDVLEFLSTLDDTYFNLDGATVQVAIADQWPGTWGGSRNSAIPYYDGSRCAAPLLNATVTKLAMGAYQYIFTPAQIATLIPGQYVVGADIARNDFRVQPILGDLTVLDGVTPQ